MAIALPHFRYGSVDVNGTFERVHHCINAPRAPSVAGPSVLMGTQGFRLMRFAAKEADAWNTSWLGRSGEPPARIAQFHAALTDLGRDPTCVELTVGQLVTFRGKTTGVMFPGGPERFTFNEPADLTAKWFRFAEMGVSHLTLWPMPEGNRCTQLIVEALHAYRRMRA